MSQAGMYPYFLSIFIKRGALRSTLVTGNSAASFQAQPLNPQNGAMGEFTLASGCAARRPE
jgi:hypothetical protein